MEAKETAWKISAWCFLAILLASSSLAGSSAAASMFNEGDQWTYDVNMSLDQLVLSGAWFVNYTGISTKTIGGQSYSLYRLDSVWSLELYGNVDNGTASGTFSENDSAYVDVDTLDTLAFESNLSVDYSVLYPPDTVQSIEYWVHNSTTYLPPGGVGNEPNQVTVGSEWSTTHTVSYDVTEFQGTATDHYSGTATETIYYSILDRQEITVPAGTFTCWVLQETYSDGTATRWISDEVGSDVKIIAEYASGQHMTAILTDYTYWVTAEHEGSSTYLAAGVIAAVAAVAVVVALLYLRRRKAAQAAPPPAQPPPEKPPVSPPGEVGL